MTSFHQSKSSYLSIISSFSRAWIDNLSGILLLLLLCLPLPLVFASCRFRWAVRPSLWHNWTRHFVLACAPARDACSFIGYVQYTSTSTTSIQQRIASTRLRAADSILNAMVDYADVFLYFMRMEELWALYRATVITQEVAIRISMFTQIAGRQWTTWVQRDDGSSSLLF